MERYITSIGYTTGDIPKTIGTILGSCKIGTFLYVLLRESRPSPAVVNLYRINTILNVSTRVATVDLPSTSGLNEYTYSINTDYLVFAYINNDNNGFIIYKLDIDTLEYNILATHNLGTGSISFSTTKAFIVVDGTGETIKYRYYYTGRDAEGSYIAYDVFNGNSNIIHTISEENTGYFNDAPPIISNDLNEQFMYGFGASSTVPINEYSKKVGFTKIYPPTTYDTVNNWGFSDMTVCEFDGAYFGFGGNAYDGETLYRPIVKIDRSNLSSTVIENMTEAFADRTIICTDDYIYGVTYVWNTGFKYSKLSKTTFSIKLYRNSAEANRVDKTDYLTAVGSLNGVMREGSSITDLSITFEMDTLPQFNYVHIPAFNRYYYVNSVETVRYRLWKINLSVDALMTYKDSILSCKAFVDRNEFEFNPNIVDRKIVVEQGVDVVVEEFGNDLFNITPTTDDNYWCRYVINGYRIGVAPDPVPQES